jgi:hypothetical protein
MNKKPIPDSQGFPVSAETRHSFSGPPSFFELSGPGTLVRLVQFGKNTYDGLELSSSSISGRPGKPSYWFEEELLLRLMREARQELTQQQATARQPFSTPLPILIGNYVRQCLRMDLAVSKDWTNDFDAFVRLRLMPADRVVALVGSVARQPAYSTKHPQHQAVIAKNIFLEGQATQYVIDFAFPANRPQVGRILGPFRF